MASWHFINIGSTTSGSVYLNVQNNQAGDTFSFIKIVIREEN